MFSEDSPTKHISAQNGRSAHGLKHLITIIVRLMKTDQHLIHLPAQTVRSIFEKRIKILFQIRKEFGNIKILVIPTTGQLIHFHYKFGYIFRRKHC